MSQTYPDIPELEPVPQVIRGLVWMRATMQAIRSTETWLIFIASQILCISAGIVAGLKLFSLVGAAMGGLVGAALALYLLFRVLVPWQAKRYLRTAATEIDWRAEFREVIEAQDRLDRITKKL